MARQQTKICPVCKQLFRGRKDAVTCSARCRKRLHRAKVAMERETHPIEHAVESAVEAGEKALEHLGEAIVEELSPNIATEEGYVATPTLATPAVSPAPQPTIPATPAAATPVAPAPAPLSSAPASASSSNTSTALTPSLANVSAPPLNSYLQDPSPVSASTAPETPVASASTLEAPIAPAPAPSMVGESSPTPATPAEPKVEDLPPPSLETVAHNAGDVFNPGGTVAAAPTVPQPEESLTSASANPVSSVLNTAAAPLTEAPSTIQQNLVTPQSPKRDYLGSLKQAIKGRTAVYMRVAALLAIVSIGYFGFSSLFNTAKPVKPVSSASANSASATTVLPTNSNATSIQFNRATAVASGNSLTATGQVLFKNKNNSANAFTLQDASGSELINVNTLDGSVTIKGIKVDGSLSSAGNISTTGNFQTSNGTSLTPSGLVINSVTVCTSSGCSFNLPLTLTNAGNSFNGPNELLELNGLGQIPDSIFGANIAKLNANQTFTGDNTFTGKVVFQNAVNGSSNFEIQKADGTGDLFMVDTTSGKIGIGRTPLSTTAAILQVNGSIDLTGQVTFNGNQINTLNLADSSNIARLNANQTFAGNNTFSGNLVALNLQPATSTLTVGATTSALSLQGNLGSQLIASNGTFNTTIGFNGTPTGNLNYNFDASASPGTYTICTTVGNCVGAGGAVDTPGGNSGYLAKFTGTETIADSSILDNGLVVSVGLPSVFRSATNSTTAFRVQNANGLIDLLVADTTDSRVGISLNAGNPPQYPLDVAGDINSSSGLRVGGNLVCTSSGCGAGSGSGFYIQNGTAVQPANFNIQSTAIGSVVAVVQGASGQTADLFDIYDGSSNKVITVNNTGSVLVKPSSNSSTAFQIQNAAGNSNLFVADTANNRIGIGNLTPGYALDVNGDVNISNGSFYRINGVSICGPQATCAPTAGSSYYIQNSNSLQTGANFNISSININYVTGVLRGAIGQVADILDLQDGNGANIFTESATGSVLAKTTTNSTAGFQVQNSSGQAVFIADTVNNQVGINTSTPTATLAVNGTGLIQASSATNPTVTVSGNEITDASRTANTQGDGRAAPDSSYGIWESTTNLITNGGFESNTTGWSSQRSATLTRDTSTEEFGTASLSVTTPGSTNSEGAIAPTVNVSASTTYTISAWVKGPSGELLVLQAEDRGGVTTDHNQSFTTTGNWQRVTQTFTTVSGTTSVVPGIFTSGTHAYSFWVDGVQLEQKATATPYVETNGATATRNGSQVQAPSSLLNATQGWVAARVRMGWAYNTGGTNGIHGSGYFPHALYWGDASNNDIRLRYDPTGDTWETVRENGSSSPSANYATSAVQSFNAGDTVTVIGAWTSNNLYISVNGGPFVAAASGNTAIPNLSSITSFNIGTGGTALNNREIDSDVLWFASGGGTLSNTDASTINGFGNTDPGFSSFPGASLPSMVWQANNTNYINSSTTSNLVFNVQNSTNQSLFNVDTNLSSVNLQAATSATAALTFGNDTTANLYRSSTGTIATSGSLSVGTNISVSGTSTLTGALTANGSALFKNNTNSTTAFQIQNSTGNSLLVADTVNSRIGIGTSSPTTTLQVNGTGLFQAPTVGTGNTLTVSGNEITDATRTANTQGDGRTPPDSSYGIWEGTTNLIPNGGFESNVNNWNPNGSYTLARTTAVSKFGSASLMTTYASGVDTNMGAIAFSATSGQTYTFSAWIYVPSSWDGGAIKLSPEGSGIFSGAFTNANMALTNQWQRVTITATATGTGTGDLVIRGTTQPSVGKFIYVDGAQVEQKPYATPYVETNGSTASRTIARVQGSATAANISGTQGWVALRVRMPNTPSSYSSLGSNSPRLWSWGTTYQDFQVYLNTTYNGQIGFSRDSGRTGGVSVNSPTAWTNAGDYVTVIAAWDANNLYISTNGSAFSSSGGNGIPPSLPSTFDIGSEQGSSEVGGDYLWFAAGSGTLTNTDASNINSFGNTDPNLNSFASSASATFVWQANNVTYSYTGYQPIVFQVQNSSGSQLLGIDANASAVLLPNATSASAALILGGDSNVNLYRSAASTLTTNATFQSSALQAASLDTQAATALNVGNTNATAINLNQNTVIAAGKSLTLGGAVLAKNSIDSTNAFAIQNAAGTSNLFIADTADTRLGVGTATPLTTFNVSGSSLFQGSSSSVNSLTASGNEITDSARAVGQQGDGRATPDSSYGIWESTTNLLTNGGLESNTTGWSSSSVNSTIARDTSISKFGTASLKVSSSDGLSGVRDTGVSVTSGTAYTESAWVYASAGTPLVMQWVKQDFSTIAGSSNFTATGSWQRVSVTVTAPATETEYMFIKPTSSVPNTIFWVDGVQIEQKAYTTPYVETNGATATRNAARIQAPASLLNIAQGWVAARVTPDWSTSGYPNTSPGIFEWAKDSNNKIDLYLSQSSNTWIVSRYVGGSRDLVNIGASFSAGTSHTVVLAWDSGKLYISTDGSAFANTTITLGALSGMSGTFDIGSLGGSTPLDGNVNWFAAGTGTLTNTDATSINAFGATDPYITSFSQAAYPTMVWHANNGTYQTGTSVALQVQNSSGANLLAVDSANSAVKVGASAKLQNLTDSTNALTVNNAGGTQLFNVNTANLQVSVANLQSSGSVNIVNPQGSISLSPGISSPNGLTLSGNEITDTERAQGATTTNVQGQSYDGKTNDSSMGVWESTTNLETNGGAETNTTNTSGTGGGTVTITRDTSASKFGAASFKVVIGGDSATQGIKWGNSPSYNVPVSTSTTYTASAWIKGTTGTEALRVGIAWYDSLNNLLSTSTSNFTASTTFTRQSVTGTSPSNAAAAFIFVSAQGTSAYTYWVDGAQLEVKSFATPYVETNGSTTGRSAARIQAPASMMNGTQGWFAARVRLGLSSSTTPSFNLFALSDGTSNNRISGKATGTGWAVIDVSNGTIVDTDTQTLSYSPGDYATAIFAYTANQLYVSMNGSSFTTISRTSIPTNLNTLDIGTLLGTSNFFDGDILWTAAGTGTLSSNDASTLNGLGNTDPTYARLTSLNNGNAVPTFVWNGSTTAYQDSTSSNGDSLIYAANTSSALTGNLLDLQSGSVPSSKFNVDTSGNTTIAGTLKVGGISTFTGSTLKPVNDSTTAFQIQNAGGSSLFNVDSTNSQIALGSAVTLVLGNKSTAGDPASPVNGEIYYNSSLNAFRCYQAGVWVNCTGSGGGGGGSGDVSQGGNTFGANMVLGTNDNYSLALRTNAINVMTLGTNGSALFQNSADSTTAFQIQNLAGTSNLFVADTTNSRIGIGTASPTSTLSVNGSTTIQQSTATSPSLTVSGNEITDVSRTTNTQGDGTTPPDSSYGIWESTTNILLNGGFESNTTNWSSSNGATLTQVTSQHKFGNGSMQIVTPGSVTNEGTTSISVAASPSVVYTGSVWVYAPSGVSLRMFITSRDSSTNTITSTITTFTGTGGWQRVSATQTFPSNAANATISVQTNATVATTLYIDGAQIEQKAVATPYVETNGVAATRSVARVQAPSSNLNATQGWVAMRIRPGWAYNNTPSAFPGFFDWRTDTSNRLSLSYTSTTDKFAAESYNGGVSASATSALQSFTPGSLVTVVMAWTSTSVQLSVNGSGFTVNGARTVPTLSGTSFDIGGLAGSLNADSDFLWVATGTGTLTNTDAANINAFGNTDPSFGSFAGTANPTMTWAANNASYSNSAASSGLVLNLQNSTGTNLLGVDATANQITASTSAVFKNSVNGTGAFQIQNAGGNNLLSVDTINNLVNLGTPGASGVNGSVVFNSATASNYAVTLGVSSSQTASYTLKLPTAAPTTGQCVQVDATDSTQLDFVTCASGGGTGDLQAAYNSSSSPATIATSSAAKGIIFKGGSGNDSTTLFQVQNSSGTAVLDVDTTNGRVGIGTNAPTARLDVASGTQTVIRGNSTGSNDILDLASNGTNTLTVSSTGAVLAKNTTDSTSAFAIQNAAGTSNLFIADTIDSRLGIGTATPVATVNVVGSTLIQQGVATNLTVSGNEITDAIRTANTQGDGRTAPDSSYGIWESTTNLFGNGGFESSAGGTAQGSNTITRSTSFAKFGSASDQLTYNNDLRLYVSSGFTLSTTTTYTASVWVYIPTGWTGGALSLGDDGTFAGKTIVSSTSANPALLDQWQRIYMTFTTATDNTGGIYIRPGSTPGVGQSVYIDGLQLEQKAYATPYVDTNGSTATRNADSVSAPSTLLNSSQSWVALRLRMGFASTANSSNGIDFSWDDGSDNNRIQLFWNAASSRWETRRVVGGTQGSIAFVTDSFSAGDMRTLILSWNSSTIGISLNGANFINTSNSNAPTGLLNTFRIGSGNGASYMDSDFLWFTAGTGTLSNTDASSINGFGNTDPNFSQFSGAADPTFLWHANTSAYQTTSNANIALQVSNTSGSSLLSLDAANAKLTVNTAGLFQNNTNSANALTVNTASGTQLFNVNTSNLQVTASNLQSSGAVNLVNSNGTVSLASSLQSTNRLTTSGNEITDTVRSASLMGDGQASPDSSYGIWESTTNMLLNGGAETNSSNVGSANSATITRTTSFSKFGVGSMQVVTPGSVSAEGISYNTASSLAAPSGNTYTGSVWVKGSGTVNVWTRIVNSDASLTEGTNSTVTLTSSWQRVVAPSVSVASGKTGDNIILFIRTNSIQATTFYTDGAQIEQKNYATPYVETNGATASRSAGRIQVPTNYVNINQGWAAFRVRAGVASSALTTSGRLIEWDADSNNKLYLGDIVGPVWKLGRVVGGVDSFVSVNANFNAGDLITIVASWTSTQLSVSVNGSAFTTAANTTIPNMSSTSTFDIGSNAGTGLHWDGDILWAATGTGTLSGSDASTINGYGSTDPTLAKLYSLNAQAANPTFMWNASTANYQDATSSNGDSLIYAANTTGTTGNLIDVQSGAFPSSRFSVSTTGQTLVQTSTNSTTAFQVQNSSGSAALSVDTVNNQVGINTSTPTATLAVNGTGLIQANSNTNPLLTTSGNEITDATRSSSAYGDGRTSPDSSYGVWEGTTNLEANGGFETNTTGYGGFANGLTPAPTLSTDNTKAKFGVNSMKVVTGGAYVREGTIQTITSGISANTTYTYSAWIWAAAGQSMQLNIDWKNSGVFISSQAITFTGTGAWQHIVDTGTSPASTNQATLDIYTNNPVATPTTFWADGVQMEQKGFATPYVDTNGSTASRNNARVQAPATSLTATQGWVVIRGRYGFPSSQASGQRAFWFGDGTSNSTNRIAGTFQPNSIQINENANGGTTETASMNSLPSWNAGDTYTALFAWTSSTIYLSYNGSVFTTVSRTQIPTGLTALDLASTVGSNSQLDGDIFWEAAGTGTLTYTDAVNLYSLGNTDPGFSTFPGYSQPTMVWQANTASYINNGNISNLVFNVQNSLGQSLLNVDTNSSSVNLQNATSAGAALTFGNDTLANLYRSTSGTIATSGSLSAAGNISAAGTGLISGNFTNNGSALFQNSTNSTTAFQIQNSAGTSNLLVADTVNSRIGIGTNAPTATLAVNGTGLIQASSASNPTVTVSGNEITDASRTASTSGDGRTAPDSSYGIWEPTTNLVTNGGFETNTTAWTPNDGGTVSLSASRDTTQHKFGSASLKLTNTATGEDDFYSSSNLTISPSTTYTVSAWVNASGFTNPASSNRILQVVNQAPASVGQVTLTSATSGWVKETLTFTTGASDSFVNIRLYAPQGTVYWDGVQLEAKSMATPYVETNGTTATRNGSEVQLPVTAANTTQGWMAMRVRVGFPSTVTPSNPTEFGSLSIDGNNRLQIVWASGSWSTRRVAGGVQGSTASVSDSFSTGDMRTLIIKWDASTISLSVNGSLFSSATATNSNTFTPTKFDIGSQGGGSNADSDFLWFAAGTGTLSDSEATNLNGFGNTDPGYSSFAGADATTAVWQANNTSYINSSSNSPLAFNVTNSSGSSLLNVDANLGTINLQGATSAASSLIFGNDTSANLYRSTTGTIATSGSLAAAGNLTVNGNTKLQTSVNSTTAFQIQNASSTNLLVADTANSRVGVGAAPSVASAAATLQVSGTASVQTAAASAVTASGNEVTDTRRAEGASTTNVAGHSYDGRTNDSSYGVWESSTNLVTNGGLETNVTGWTASGTNTVARDTTKAKFGTASLKATYQNNIQLAAFNNITVTSGQTYTASAWVYVPLSYNGTQPQLEIDGGAVAIPLGTRNAWQRVSVTFSATSSSDNLAVIERGTVPSAGQSIYIDGAQVENKPVATPYIETNGTTQTRNASSVTAPSTLINATQGWVAARVRMGYNSTGTMPAGGFPGIFSWSDAGVNNQLNLFVAGSGWVAKQKLSGTATSATVTQAYTAGSYVTVVMYWKSNQIAISVNGSSYSTATLSGPITTALGSTFNIGTGDAGNQIDGDVLWMATGTGTLTNTDAAAINSFGSADPDLTYFSSQDSSSTPTLVWKANSANYQNQLAFSVQNSSGANELGVDVADGSVLFGNATTSASALILGNDANLYRSASQTLKTDGNLTVGTNLTVNGTALLQNATDSTTAFQINNASGSTLIGVDTLHSSVAIGTTPSSTDTLTLKGAVGGATSIQLQRTDNSSNALKIFVSPQANIVAEAQPLYIDAGGTNSVHIGNDSGSGHATTAPTLIVQGVSAQTADLLQVQTSTPLTVFKVGATGSVLAQNSTDSTTAFQIQNQAGNSNLFVADTLNSKVGINEAPSSTGAALQVGGDVDITGNYKINGSQISSSNLSDASNIALLNGTGPQTFTGDNKFTGITTFKNASDSTSAVQIQNSTGTSNLFIADTTDTRIAIAQASAAYTLDVGGDINTTGLIRINGAQVSTSSLSDGSNIGLLNANNTFSGNNTFTGTVLAKNTSTTAFQIQNAGGTQLLVADTSNMRLYIGNPSGDTTNGTLLVLDNISNAGDPAGINGAMYYNSTSGKFRCYEASVWTNCIDSSQLAATSGTQTVSATSYGDVTGLGFSVLATKNYMLQCSLLISVTGNGGNVSMTGPASPTNYTATFQKTSDQSAGDTFTTSSTYDDSNSSTAFRIQTSTTGTNKFILTYNAVLNNGSNAGTWQLRAKATDGTSSIVFYPTSTCTLRPF